MAFSPTLPHYTPAAGKGIPFDHMTTVLENTNAIGTYVAVTYAAGTFTGNGSMTWTVDAGDQKTLKYVRYAKKIIAIFSIELSTVGGTLNTDLRIAIPLSLTAATRMTGHLYYLDNGTHGTGMAVVDPGDTTIRLVKSGWGNWAASTNLTSVLGRIEIETTT